MSEERLPADAGRIGSYEILGVIGRGGMAEVLRARSPTGDLVAIKRLRPTADDGAELSMALHDEARLLARIRHPNVIRIHEVVADAAGPFIVMDYVDGASLRTVMETEASASGRIPIEVAVCVIIDVLEGLHAAHSALDERGEALHIVHRDVSPENILVAGDGHAVLSDFGVALAPGRLQKTVSNQIKGKVSYIAPEQVHGLATAASDVFSTASVLYELLTGERLVRARATSEALAELLSLKVKPPSAQGVVLPPAVEVALLRGLARRPEERFGSAEEFARALKAAMPEATRDVVSHWIALRLPKASAREPRARSLVAAATLLTLLVVVAAVLYVLAVGRVR